MTTAGIVIFIILFGFVFLDPTKNPIGLALFIITVLIVGVANYAAIGAWFNSYFAKKNNNKGEEDDRR